MNLFAFTKHCLVDAEILHSQWRPFVDKIWPEFYLEDPTCCHLSLKEGSFPNWAANYFLIQGIKHPFWWSIHHGSQRNDENVADPRSNCQHWEHCESRKSNFSMQCDAHVQSGYLNYWKAEYNRGYDCLGDISVERFLQDLSISVQPDADGDVGVVRDFRNFP